MLKRLTAFTARVDAMSLRERAVGYLAALAVLYFMWDLALFAPLDAKRSALGKRVGQVHTQIATVNTQVGQLAALRSADPDRSNRQSLSTMLVESKRLAGELVSVTDRLVPPADMAELLESLIVEQRALRLVRLEGLGVEPIGLPAASADAGAPPGAEAIPGLYRHGLRVVLRGSYLDALAYIRAVESLSWDLLWDSVQIEVQEHPSAEITLTVYSLSLDEGWIGV